MAITHVLPRSTFISFEVVDGPVSYPDKTEFFTQSGIITNPESRKSYIVASYSGDKLITPAVTYDEYFDISVRSRAIETYLKDIKALQKKMLISIEGVDGVNQRKAIEEITTLSSFENYDTLIKNKAWIRKSGNDQEAALLTMSVDEMIAYEPSIDLALAPDLIFGRITVGAFELRFSSTEHARVVEARKTSPDLDRWYRSMVSRSHIDLTSTDIKTSLKTLMENGVLDATPEDPSFANRKEEILRGGCTNEVYRVISYI